LGEYAITNLKKPAKNLSQALKAIQTAQKQNANFNLLRNYKKHLNQLFIDDIADLQSDYETLSNDESWSKLQNAYLDQKVQGNPAYFLLKSKLLNDQKQYIHAFEALEQANFIDPHFDGLDQHFHQTLRLSNPQYNQARLEFENQNYKETIEILKTLSTNLPFEGQWLVYQTMGWSYYLLDQFDLALTHFTQSMVSGENKTLSYKGFLLSKLNVLIKEKASVSEIDQYVRELLPNLTNNHKYQPLYLSLIDQLNRHGYYLQAELLLENTYNIFADKNARWHQLYSEFYNHFAMPMSDHVANEHIKRASLVSPQYLADTFEQLKINPILKSHAILHLAWGFYAQQKYDEALFHFLKAKTTIKTQKQSANADFINLQSIQRGIGLSYYHIGETSQAINFLENV
ncbi:MAG: hypothetical protein AAF403_08615, partial [Pseudomonadota bacterium]